jgi:hypothetical protein
MTQLGLQFVFATEEEMDVLDRLGIRGGTECVVIVAPWMQEKLKEKCVTSANELDEEYHYHMEGDHCDAWVDVLDERMPWFLDNVSEEMGPFLSRRLKRISQSRHAR